ncbi:hypothetical protein J4441_01470 [Candidatus Micrarchaeota archaeon]|nr:hypothetical protein [Candidatus Micrarchaeota archaeon]
MAAANTYMRGQAAMEYLVTYGWAILALLVVLAALVSSGIFTASRFIWEECTFQPNLQCSPFILYSSDSSSTLQFSVLNGLGFPVRFTGINATLANGEQMNALLEDTVTEEGTKAAFTTTLASPLPKGSRQTIYVQLSYVNCLTTDTNACDEATASGEYVSSGKILANVQPQ